MKFFQKSLAAVLAIAIVVAGITYFPSVAKDVEAAPNYDLVWSDEFNGTKLDTNTWSYEIGNGSWGWGNGEVEYYTDREDNVKVSDGFLQIIAKRENYGGQEFTSGRIITKGKKYFKYGKMEARIKVENGNQSGVWPAFWMMGENISQGVGWPNCGEIDIMEHANANNYVGGCLHWNYEGINGNWDKHGSYGSGDEGKDYVFTDNVNNGINGWHTYGLVWDESHMEWQVDGVTYFQQDITENNAYCFQKAHFFLFNLAIGGTGSGYTGYQTAGPDFQTTTMYVDYLRVYQEKKEETTSYNGPTITVTQDAVAESTAAWGSYFGNADWCDNANGALTANGTKAADGATVNVSRIGSDRWGVQAFLSGLKYYPGNIYTYKCTLISDKNKVVFVKVAGDDSDEISGQYVSLQAGVPYDYTAQVNIPEDYNGVLDLYFGLGRCDGDTLSNADGYTLNISNVSFTTTATIPDPNYVPPTTKAPATTPPKTTTSATEQPKTTTQATIQPDPIESVTVPEATQPGTTIPAMTQPDTVEVTTVSTTEQPNTTVPTAEQPNTIAPTMAQPNTAEKTTAANNLAKDQDVIAQLQKAEKPKIKKAVKKKKAKKLKITLKAKLKISNGYQLRIYRKKKNAKAGTKALARLTYKKNKKAFTVKSGKLKNAKTLYLRIREYVIVGGKKHFGKWSAVKKVKIK